MKLRLNIVFAVVMSAVMVSGCSEKSPESAQVVAPAPPDHGPAPERLSDVGWRLHGHDVGEQRYSKLDQINRGVAYHDGKVIVATYDGRLVANLARQMVALVSGDNFYQGNRI